MEKKKTVSGGSFKTMDLMPSILKNIHRLNYKQPTPIQRKTIPALLMGRDVVGMARTGSGKTAAFAVPIIQSLKEHSGVVGSRAIIISPTRELAVQTAKVLSTLSKGTGLRIATIVGGDSVDEQFGAMASNPDVLIGTPGRLLHLSMETGLSLKRIQMAVFDEADRLFEMGFSEQLTALLQLMPSDTRQTVLFSATLPSSLAEFAAAGLRADALFVRLDADLKLSPDLTNKMFLLKSEYRTAALLLLLQSVYTSKDTDKLTLVFTATKHHVEYLVELLQSLNYKCGGVYGSMDQVARQQSLDNFRAHRWPILVVTDIAARGLDIPFLDNVINYDFPCSGKLFIHRVGRVARAGRPGTAFSLMTSDEVPYYCDLSAFLNTGDLARTIPQDLLDLHSETVKQRASLHPGLSTLARVMQNAYKQYWSSRTPATSEAYSKAKLLCAGSCQVDPQFQTENSQAVKLKEAIKAFKPKNNMLLTKMQKPLRVVEPKKQASDNDYYMSYEPKGTNQLEDRAYQLRSEASDDFMKMAAVRPAKNSDKPGKNPKIKLADGATLPGSFKGRLYDQWKKKTHVALPKLGEQELPSNTQHALSVKKKRWTSKNKTSRSSGTKSGTRNKTKPGHVGKKSRK